MNVQNREDDLVIVDFLGQLDNVEPVMEKVDVLSLVDASYKEVSLDNSETKEVSNITEEVHASKVQDLYWFASKVQA